MESITWHLIEAKYECGFYKLRSGGGCHLDAGAHTETVTDDAALKVTAIKAKEALIKDIYNSTSCKLPGKPAPN